MAAPQTDPQYKLRLPQDLKDRLGAAARAANRSVNAEILARLQASFGGQNGDWAEDPNLVSDVESLGNQLIRAAAVARKTGQRITIVVGGGDQPSSARPESMSAGLVTASKLSARTPERKPDLSPDKETASAEQSAPQKRGRYLDL